MKIFDIFLFYNELDLLEIRLNTLNDHVDFFVITESTRTFSGNDKPLYFLENKEKFSKYLHKIIHNIVKDDNIYEHKYFTNKYLSYSHKSNGKRLIDLSKDCQREVYQRDSCINSLLNLLSDDDLILSSDIDEIPDPKCFNQFFVNNINKNNIYHFKQKWYQYYLNNYCEKDWFGTRACFFKKFKQVGSVDLLRYHTENKDLQDGIIIDNAGWHFSFIGGIDKIKLKINSYAFKGNTRTILLNFIFKFNKSILKKLIDNNQDLMFSGKKFTTVKIDHTFPKYIQENVHKFKLLIKS